MLNVTELVGLTFGEGVANDLCMVNTLRSSLLRARRPCFSRGDHQLPDFLACFLLRRVGNWD